VRVSYLELLFSAFSELLCTLREIWKRLCDNDMDQLSFCVFSPKNVPQMGQKQTRVLNNRFLWTYHSMQIWEETHTPSRTFAFYLGEPRLLRIFFHIIIVETTHLTRPENDFKLNQICFYSDLGKVFQSPEFQAKLFFKRIWVGGS